MERVSLSHVSVLLEEALEALLPTGASIHRAIDGTLGAGGHTGAMLARDVDEVLAFDLDPQAIAIARAHLVAWGERAHIVQASYEAMATHAHARGWQNVDAILLDLGVSSMQFDTAERGFSFRFDAPLDMRFTADGRHTAQDILNYWEANDLADIFFKYGEERFGRQIARAIVGARPLETTQQLADLIGRVVPKNYDKRTHTKSIHPATRVFQALRIAVNDELGVLERTLPQAIDLLARGGRLAVISFHSLEDALVKHVFKEASTSFTPPRGMASLQEKHASVRLITKKPIEASAQELNANPRSRSAKLRVIEKL